MIIIRTRPSLISNPSKETTDISLHTETNKPAPRTPQAIILNDQFSKEIKNFRHCLAARAEDLLKSRVPTGSVATARKPSPPWRRHELIRQSGEVIGLNLDFGRLFLKLGRSRELD